eukprot:7819520-Pyramimonas_sp.AAC.1
MPFHKDNFSNRFTDVVVSYDEFDCWVCFSDLLANWPPEGREHDHQREKPRRHRALPQAQALGIPSTSSAEKKCEMVDRNAGMQKNRLQVKKTILRGITCPTYNLRPSNGHSSPGIRHPESLYSR